MAPVTCDVQVEFSSPYYGRLILSKIRNEDNTPVTINSFLGLAFKSPAQVDKPYFTVSLTPWQAVTAMVTNEPVKSSLYTVLAGLHLESPHTFNTNDTITIDINGDLNADAETYVKSFVLAADKMPDTNGKVDVHCQEHAPRDARQCAAEGHSHGGQASDHRAHGAR
ncbi:hypothetical protein N657DRAFT_650883 [Parathielavia appendiculata]|uniref:Uncharacterized protein n=1 Tax=Parathielavia appendiculata TaxID=2587402 RepID=A0AAN6TQJ4_9PEZI|nr:hypothetical protein N657DRAFT_650883 [Parathielavia appendiculata]